MTLPRLQVILDVAVATDAGWMIPDLAAALLEGGARWIQVRGGGTPSGRLLDICDEVVALGRAQGASVIVNDRLDLARLAGAAGAHVGQADIHPAHARQILGPAAMLGVSTHTLAQVEAARLEPVSYIAVGPVFATSTKATGYEPRGLGFLREAAQLASPTPVVAIGGITLARAPSVLETGAAAVAVIGDVLRDRDPARRVAAYLEVLAEAGPV